MEASKTQDLYSLSYLLMNVLECIGFLLQTTLESPGSDALEPFICEAFTFKLMLLPYAVAFGIFKGDIYLTGITEYDSPILEL